ncbi:HemK2/MTQ2 family protein methyltransferase [Streptomyces sp. NPDC047886]|uniref:HemK2/MTQ2 family protein methyltransferase n=1 Tax=Streptomyces sp. NPDC047886 TaxID=3365490 RepID=UPI003715D511
MPLLRTDRVYTPQEDTELLARAARAELRALRRGRPAEVLDVGTGSGALALVAARSGRARVTAVDIDRRAVEEARRNARRLGLPVRVLHGDLTEPVAGRGFDLILSNPPYVISPGAAGDTDRSWHAGADGRDVLDRLCAEAPGLLRDGGVLLLVQSALSDVGATLDALRASGLRAGVETRATIPFGPVMERHARWLEARGLIRPGERVEDLVVIRAERR